MQVRHVGDVEELVELAPAWDRLASRCRGPVLARPLWCLPWVRHRLGCARPDVVTVVDDGELVGLAPLQVLRFGPVELLRLLGHGMGTVSGFLVEPGRPDVAERLWEELLGRRRLVHLVELVGAQAGPSDRAAGGRTSRTPRDACLVVDAATTHDEYLAARSKKLRENLRRARRAADRAGGWQVEVVTGAERVLEVRGELVAVSAAAETAHARLDLFGATLAPFADDLLATAAEAGALRLFVGRLDGEAVAAGVAFDLDEVLSFWWTAFDPGHREAAPGVLLLDAVVAHGFEQRARRVDLLLGDTEHKRRWSTDRYPTYTVVGGSSPVLRACGTLALEVAARRHRAGGATAPSRAARPPS